MDKKKIRKIVLELLLECIEDTHNYPPDDYIDDLKDTIEKKLEAR